MKSRGGLKNLAGRPLFQGTSSSCAGELAATIGVSLLLQPCGSDPTSHATTRAAVRESASCSRDASAEIPAKIAEPRPVIAATKARSPDAPFGRRSQLRGRGGSTSKSPMLTLRRDSAATRNDDAHPFAAAPSRRWPTSRAECSDREQEIRLARDRRVLLSRLPEIGPRARRSRHPLPREGHPRFRRRCSARCGTGSLSRRCPRRQREECVRLDPFLVHRRSLSAGTSQLVP